MKYFKSLVGLNNIHAKSKVHNAINYISNSSTTFDRIILIGDTFHDFEVAQEINAECILVSNGHQILDKKKINGNARIINSLRDISHLQI